MSGWRPYAATALSLLGIGVTIYLTIEHFGGNKLAGCPENSTINCLKVTTSPQSMVFGIPVAVLGLAFFVAMFLINLPPVWRSSIWWVPWLRLLMAVGGMCFVVYLIYSEVFTIKAICLWCTSVHILTFLLFVLILSSVSETFRAQLEPGDWEEPEETNVSRRRGQPAASEASG